MTHQPLLGQTAIVTGASSGIGRETARYLARAGAAVTINYHSNEDGARKIAGEIEAEGGRTLVVQGDVGKEEDVQRIFRETSEAFGRIDILVANAGMQKDAALREMTLDDWNAVINTNLTGAFIATREAVRHFMGHTIDEERSKARGKIIYTSSVHERIPWAGHINYAAAKGGMMQLMKSTAQEVARYRIRVNSVAPGAIATDINDDVLDDPDKGRAVLDLIPYNRIGQPEEVAKAIVWLASDDADYIVGSTLFIDGGMSLYPGFRDNG